MMEGKVSGDDNLRNRLAMLRRELNRCRRKIGLHVNDPQPFGLTVSSCGGVPIRSGRPTVGEFSVQPLERLSEFTNVPISAERFGCNRGEKYSIIRFDLRR